VVINEGEGCQNLGALPYVHTIHEQYVKLHEHHYLHTYNISFQMSQNSMQTTYPVLVHKPIKYDIHTICDMLIFVVQLTQRRIYLCC